jgi:Na+/phosphate symporter
VNDPIMGIIADRTNTKWGKFRPYLLWMMLPLVVIGVLLFFARRKETTRALGALTAALGVLTMLIPTTLIGTCVNDQMVCNTEMKPTLLIAGGITIALGIAVLVVGERTRENGGAGPAAAA